jgi:hypothetical protein
MTDELQTDVTEDVTTESHDEPTIQNEAESATAEQEVVKEKVTFSDEQQEILNGITADKTKKFREAERRAEAAEQRLREAEAKIPQAQAPTVPEMPDYLDDDFNEKVKARDEAIKASAAYDYQQQASQARQQQAQQQQQQQAQQARHEKAQTFASNATKQGITQEQLQSAAVTIDSFNLRQDVVDAMLGDDQGGTMAIYLAKNPHVIEQLNGANVIQLGSVYNEIRTNAGAASKKTVAPPPHESLSGAGSPVKDDGPPGATFE